MGGRALAVTGLVLQLIEELGRDLQRAYTINQLAHSIGKAYPNVHTAVKQLLDQNILIKDVIGHSHNCRLNLTNQTTCLLLSLAQDQKKQRYLTAHPDATNALTSYMNDPNVLMVWEHNEQLTVVTAKPAHPHVLVTDFALQTAGEGTLLYGHATYADLLRKEGQQ